MKLRNAIIVSGVGVTLSAALLIGTGIANNYGGLLDVYFTKSTYTASSSEKDVCRQVAEEGAVLLQNKDNALPLASTETKLALLGQNSVDFVYGGAGSGSVDTSTAPNLKTALESEGYTVNSTLWNFYDTGAGSTYRKQTPDETGRGSFVVNEVPLSVYTDEVKASLDSDDVAICTVGRSGGESADLPKTALSTGYTYLQLDNDERDMIKLACSKFSKVILLVNANNPVELGFLEEAEYANVKAAIWLGGVGQEGLYAVGRILNGTVAPSGRLVDTYAYDSTSAPSTVNLGNYSITNSSVENGAKYLVYGEGIYVGYRYYETRYEDVVLGNTTGFDYSKAVQFPFGYGLSYTTFSWSDFEVKEIEGGYEASVTVKNTGDYAGKEVVEIYAQKPYTAGGVEVASVELVGFGKTKTLSAGATEKVTVTIDKEDLAVYDDSGAKTYVLGKGDYYIAAGKNAHDGLNNILAAKGKTVDDGMTAKGESAYAKKVMTLDAVDSTSCATSSVTGKAITNRMEDVDINYYDSYTYLSRADWSGTFPTVFANGSYAAPQALLDDLPFFDVSTDTEDDAAVAAFTFRTNSETTAYTVQDLVDAEYTDARWDDLVAQLSYKQMTKLIRLGGYSTQQIDRIGLPKTQDKDGPSGISGTLVGGTSAMAWPAEVVMASTWNVSLMEALGTYFGEDSIALGVAGVYGPGANIHRSPYSGRNFEYYSEDPCLSGKIGAAEMKGLRKMGVITYAKHFALNDQETNRYGGAFFAKEQAAREIFLKGFEDIVVEGKTNALMCAMNRAGARWIGAHKGIMTNILRDEWGFEGFVITDQASVPAMFYQDHISGLWAGTNMWLNTSDSYWSLDEVKDDETMQYYIHHRAKDIIYGITKSWAVDERYKANGGAPVESTATTFPWWNTLVAADCAVVGGFGVAIALCWFFYLKGSKAVGA
ncbi:MAG: glycoside hydrolase family 3 C-terminal domain-containing protein [Bacilli bacterium]|nr:glycoside hydrolase family 3 C-terminal domain-containing protein [Bacilli bacterium]